VSPSPDPLDPRLAVEAARHPFPLVFATVSGAHLYGFPSPDSDFDLRGAHVLPLEEALRLEPGPETIELSEKKGDLELDLVTHDVRKFFGMLLKRNGYVLEQPRPSRGGGRPPPHRGATCAPPPPRRLTGAGRLRRLFL
jgi:hypothetical protein